MQENRHLEALEEKEVKQVKTTYIAICVDVVWWGRKLAENWESHANSAHLAYFY